MMMEVAPCASITELSTNNSIIMERAVSPALCSLLLMPLCPPHFTVSSCPLPPGP